MNPLSNLFQHPASMLVAAALVVLFIRLGSRFLQRRNDDHGQATRSIWSQHVMCFFSGVLLTNGLAHFSHGISAEQFPAPFSYALAGGFPQYLSNVLWGFLNLVLGYGLFIKSNAFHQGLAGKIAFFAGVLAMGIFLAYFFSR